MRLREVERGDTLTHRILMPFISLVAGMRLPDAARAVFYHKSFFGNPMSLWTHAAMRGESTWSAGERELMAAMTAKWNSCPFCIGAHVAIATRVLGRPLVDASLQDFELAKLSPELLAVMPFLEKLTKTPDELVLADAQTVLRGGISHEAFEDMIAVCVLINITTRCANVLGYDMLDDKDLEKASKRLLEQGYAFGKGKKPAHPDHRAMAETLRTSVLEGPSVSDTALRRAIAECAATSKSMDEPFVSLAKQIREDSYKVTDDQVVTLVQKVGSEKAAYELIIAAIIGVGLYQWQCGLEVFDKATV